MNFEFKSTFKYTKAVALLLKGIRYVYLLTKNNSITLLAINIPAFCFFCYLYSQNYFIPAVYGSKPSAESWLTLFQTLGFAWILSTSFALSNLIIHITKRYQLVLRFITKANSVLMSTATLIRATIVLVVLIVTMLIQISNYTHLLVFEFKK